MITTDIQQRRLMQLALFEECLTVPDWSDLSEDTRKEVVQHLAQLLGSVHEDDTGRAEVLGGANE